MNWLKSMKKCCVKEKTYFVCLSHRLFHIHNKFSFEKSEKTVHTFTITSTCLHAGMQLVLKVCNTNENQQVDSLISLTNKPPSEENSVYPTLPNWNQSSCASWNTSSVESSESLKLEK